MDSKVIDFVFKLIAETKSREFTNYKHKRKHKTQT